MSKSRRQFLTHAPLALLGAAVAPYGQDQKPAELTSEPHPHLAPRQLLARRYHPPHLPRREKLVEAEFSSEDLAEAAGIRRKKITRLYEKGVGPRKVAMPTTLCAVVAVDPILPGHQELPQHNQFVRSKTGSRSVARQRRRHRVRLGDPAFALDRNRKLTSQRLTNIYLARLEKFNPCCVASSPSRASWRSNQARKADQEIAAGKYRGPLHGIPWEERTFWIRRGSGDNLRSGALPQSYS